MTTTTALPPTGDIAVVLGTRPEIIKLASVIIALGARARVIHTGQHWDDAMAGQFFLRLGLGEPDVRLTSMSGVHRGLQIGRGIAELTEHFEEFPVAAVIVQGDTNSTSVGAQAGSYAGVPVIHVEAGLRSYDRAMPEELNRLAIGALADLHCAATELNRDNLLREGVAPESIVVTGNTVVEATTATLEKNSGRPGEQHQVFPDGTGPRILVTIHRPENTDTADALRRVLAGLQGVSDRVVFAAHPRTLAAIERFDLSHLISGVNVRAGLGHSEFLELARQATVIVSDSGGVQEEVTVLKRPLLVVRNSTERPESIEAGFSELVTQNDDIGAALRRMLADDTLLDRLRNTPSPYGTGDAGRTIAALSTALADRV